MKVAIFGSVPAGFPSPAADYSEEQIDLNKYLQKNPSATFLVRAQGNSMQEAYIPDGAILVVDRSIRAQHGHIVLAILDGEFTVKRFIKTSAGIFLAPENASYKPIQVTPDRDFQVWGVVSFIITDAKKI